jgi:hypothetical protein
MRLARFLDRPERQTRKVIAKLESLSGYPSEDVRLLADVNQDLRDKIKSLGLDPADTTGEELYEALKVKLSGDLNHLSRAWGLGGDNSANIIQLLEHAGSKEEVLAIKASSVKTLMRALPPKKTMKLLGYRSLESMLKREDTRAVLATALANEGTQWVSRLGHKISRLKSSDYELRGIKFLDLAGTAVPGQAVGRVPLMATVYLNQVAAGPAAGQVLLALQAEAALLADSFYLSANQFSKDFNKIAERLFSGYDPMLGESFVTPHEYIKLKRHDASAHISFSQLHPALAWWKDSGHLALDDNGPVSLHLSDCLANLADKADFAARYSHNFSAELKQQLLSRYYAFEPIKNYLAAEIDDTFIPLDSISTKQLVPEFEESFN